MKTKIILSLIAGSVLFSGCANKSVSNTFIKDKSHSIKEVFDKMLYQGDYPYIYQKHLTFKGGNYNNADEIDKFNSQMKLLCNTKNGEVMSIFNFKSKYRISQEDMQDRCFDKLSGFDLCVVKKNNPIPKVLFIWTTHNHQTHRYYANYVHSYVTHNPLGYAHRVAYFDGVPDSIKIKKFNEVEEKVCIPDYNNWDFYFKSAQKAYLFKKEKEKVEKQKEIKKQKEKELKNSFRRF